jgi:hypothetical protein
MEQSVKMTRMIAMVINAFVLKELFSSTRDMEG